jgi:WD40 repeat protein
MIQEFYKKVAGIYKARFNADHQIIAFPSSDGFIRIWDRNKKGAQSMIREIPAVNFQKYRNQFGVYSVDFQSQSDLLVYGYENGEVYVWNWQQNTKPKLLGKHDLSISSVEFSYDGNLLASADYQGNIKIWKTFKSDDFKLIGKINAKNKRFASSTTYQIAFTKQGDFLASSHGDKDEGIKIWRISDIDPSKILEKPYIQLIAHIKAVKGISFLPTNQSIIISSSGDETIRIWQWQKGKISLNNLTIDNLLHQACSFGGNYLSSNQNSINIRNAYSICQNKSD